MTARRAELTITVTVEYDDEAAIIPIPSALPQRLAETSRRALTDLTKSVKTAWPVIGTDRAEEFYDKVIGLCNFTVLEICRF